MKYYVQNISSTLQMILDQEELRNILIEAITLVIDLLEAKDPYTAWHSRNVTSCSLSLWKKLWVSKEDLTVLEYSSWLHDIGKIAVRDHILNKNWKLNEEELVIMRSHVEKWWEILKMFPWLEKYSLWARMHHETLNWKWYPRWLKWDEIPFLWRIIAVADIYDALISVRAYKKSWDFDQVIDTLKRLSGTELDVEVVSALLSCIDDGECQLYKDKELFKTIENNDEISISWHIFKF